MRAPAFRLLPLAPLAALCGCVSLNPVGMATLSTFNPLAADPAAIQIAVVAPKAIRLRDGDATLKFALNSADPRWRFDETIALETTTMVLAAGIAYNPASDFVTAVRIPQADLDRMRAAQEKAQAYKAAGGEKGKGMMRVSVDHACIAGRPPEGSWPVSIYIKTDPNGDYTQLINNQDIKTLQDGRLASAIEPCPDTTAQKS